MRIPVQRDKIRTQITAATRVADAVEVTEARVVDSMMMTGVGGRVAVVTTPVDLVVTAMMTDDAPTTERIHALEIRIVGVETRIAEGRADVRGDVVRKIVIERLSTMVTFPLGIRPSRLL